MLDLDVIDEVQQVSGDDAIATRVDWPTKRGCWSVSPAAPTSPRRCGSLPVPSTQGKVIVTVAPSTGERYLSTKLWEELG